MWGMLAKVGLASDGSQPKTNVAWPLQRLSGMSKADELDEEHFKQALAAVEDKTWELVPSIKDPEEGGDMHFWTKPAVGRYQYAKITLTIRNTTVDTVLALTQSSELRVRNEFSADMCQLDMLDKTDKCQLFQLAYQAPKGVANREFVVLSGRRTLEDGSQISYGCSVDVPMAPEKSVPVRGATQYTWHCRQIGDDVMVEWNNCFDPRGWTPQFLLSWMKSAATNEFINIRAVLAGKKAKVGATQLDISEEELAKQKAEAKE